jgi:2-methylcitrate dehydratase PrpD
MTAPALTRRSALLAGLASGVAGLSGRLPAADGLSLSEALAAAVVAANAQPLPSDVAERTAWTLLDGLGAMVHGAAQPSVRRDIAPFVSRSGSPTASVVGHGRAVPAELAAAANAYLLHAEEVDDSDLLAQLRASAVILPVALAMAEALDVSGAAFLRAAALGYTIQRRLAAPLGPTQRFGWMASGVWGPPAASAMAASMLGLPASGIAAALALAGSASGGSFQYFYDQTEEKRLIVARGARIAIESARLAATGVAGARRILEGTAGLYRLIGGEGATLPTANALSAELGRREGPLFLHPKYYSASSSIIPMLDGLRADLPPTLRPEQITGFTVRGDAGWARVLAGKIDTFVPPDTRIGAMINFSYMVALFVSRRSALPRDLTAAALRDPAILALAARGRFVTAPTREVTIDFALAGGGTCTATARTPPVDRPAPLDAARRMEKFDGLTTPVLGEARQSALKAACLTVGQARSMRGWASQLRRTSAQGGHS